MWMLYLLKALRWQRFNLRSILPWVKRDCTLFDIVDTNAIFCESGSDSRWTIPLDQIKGCDLAENWKYAGMVSCWTLR
jgi:hypothetical protein